MGKHETPNNFSVLRLGELTQLSQYTFTHSALPFGVEGKKFLKDDLGLTGMEVSFNKMPAGMGMPFHHKHQENEELYLFLRGNGQFQVDGETVDVAEGTAIRVAPAAVRSWRNNSQDDLYYVVIQAKANTMKATSISDGVALKDEVRWP
jgi:mannose-6-phosphate isomerase-like protein (cupin superfamily)